MLCSSSTNLNVGPRPCTCATTITHTLAYSDRSVIAMLTCADNLSESSAFELIGLRLAVMAFTYARAVISRSRYRSCWNVRWMTACNEQYR